jgi:hypothetical protein
VDAIRVKNPELDLATVYRQLAPREAARARGDLAAAVATDLDVWASAHHG